MSKSYSDRAPDTPENRNVIGGFGGAGDQLSSIRKPTRVERKRARDYLEREAPDLVEMLGLA